MSETETKSAFAFNYRQIMLSVIDWFDYNHEISEGQIQALLEQHGSTEVAINTGIERRGSLVYFQVRFEPPLPSEVVDQIRQQAEKEVLDLCVASMRLRRLTAFKEHQRWSKELTAELEETHKVLTALQTTLEAGVEGAEKAASMIETAEKLTPTVARILVLIGQIGAAVGLGS